MCSCIIYMYPQDIPVTRLYSYVMVYHSYVLVCHRYITRMSSVCHSYVILISLVCTHMSSVCHSYVLACHLYANRMCSYVTCMSLACTRMPLVCHLYVARMYSNAIRMSLECTRMSSVCHSYVLVWQSYVTCMWFYHEPFFCFSKVILNKFISFSIALKKLILVFFADLFTRDTYLCLINHVNRKGITI